MTETKTETIQLDQTSTETIQAIRARVTEEIPHLEHIISVCDEEHVVSITPLVGLMYSFARFCNKEDNKFFLNSMKELFVSYAYNKKRKTPHERKATKELIKRYGELENMLAKDDPIEFQYDFFPHIRQYQFMLIAGHKQGNDESLLCDAMLARVKEIAKRNLQENYHALKQCDRALQ